MKGTYEEEPPKFRPLGTVFPLAEKTKNRAQVEVTSFPTPTVEESGVAWWLVLGNQALSWLWQSPFSWLEKYTLGHAKTLVHSG